MDPTSTPPGPPPGTPSDPPQAPTYGGPTYGGPPPGGPPPGGPPPGGPTYGTPPPGGAGGPGPGGTGLQSFFDSLRRSGFVRPDESTRSGAGVCTAVAHRLGVDTTLVRVGVVLLAVFGGVGLLAYGVAWLLFPQADGRIHAEDLLRGHFTAGGIGSLLAIFFGFGGFGRWWWMPGENWGAAIALVSVVGVALLIGWALTRQGGDGTGAAPTEGPSSAASVAPPGTAPTRVDLDKGQERVSLGKALTDIRPLAPRPPLVVAPPPPRRRPAGPAVTALVAGLSLLAAAAILLVDRVDPLPVHVPLVAAVAALALIGLAVVVVGLVGRRAGGLTGLAVVTLVLVVVGWGDARVDGVLSDWRSADESSSFDDARWQPSGELTEDRSYAVDFGSGTLDLSDVDPLGAGDEPATLTASVRFGSMRVLVPDDLTVELVLDASEGRVAAPGEGDGGNRDISTTIGPDGPVDVRIEGTARLGELVVEEVSR
jgi:phage shock protein PspC (stress-responsive transcriptional regulator)